jgi:hypothetical protein
VPPNNAKPRRNFLCRLNISERRTLPGKLLCSRRRLAQIAPMEGQAGHEGKRDAFLLPRRSGPLGFIFRLAWVAANTLNIRHAGGGEVRNCRGDQVPLNGGCTGSRRQKAMDGFFDHDLRSGSAAKQLRTRTFATTMSLASSDSRAYRSDG